MSLRLKLENDIYGGNRLQVAAPAQTVKSTVSQVAPASTTRLSVPQPKPNVVGSLSMGSTSSVGVTPVQRSYDDNPVSQTSRILSPVRKVTSQMPSMHQYVKDATDMRNDRIERGFKANKSIQDISNDSGASTNEVLRYKDTYHPTYGDKGLIRNILEGGKNIAVDTFNKAAGIVTKPYNDLTYDPHKANQELININLQRRIGDLTDEAASEKAQQLADKFTNKKVVTDSNGMLAIQQGDTLDFAKKIAQQGVDTSNVVPAGRVVNGVRQAAGAEIAKSIAMTNAKQAAVYGTASTANDVLQGRGITPESLAMNYGAPAVLGTASELAGRGVGNAWSRARGVPQLPGPTATSPKRAVDTPAQAQARQVQELNATQPRLTPEQVADINAQKALADAPTEAMAALKQEARKYKSADEFVKNTDHTPQTTRVYIKSKFRDGGGYADVPVIREEKNITLYQGGTGENRQFWTPNKEYAKKFGNGEVVKKTGNFYQIDNGNRMTDVYVDADKQLTDLYNQAHSQPTPKVEATQPTVAPKGAPIEKTPKSPQELTKAGKVHGQEEYAQYLASKKGTIVEANDPVMDRFTFSSQNEKTETLRALETYNNYVRNDLPEGDIFARLEGSYGTVVKDNVSDIISKKKEQLTDLYNQAHAEATPTPKQPTPFEQDLQAAGIKPTPKVEAPQATVALEQGMDAKTAQKLYDTYDVTGVPAHVKQMMRDNGARQSDINKLNNQIKQAYAIIEPDKYKLASQPPTPKVEAPKGAPIEKTPNVKTSVDFYDATKGETYGSIYATRNGKRVGKMDVSLLDNGDIVVNNVEVDPKYRRQGIATELYKEASKQSKSGYVNPTGQTELGSVTRKSLEGKGVIKSRPQPKYEQPKPFTQDEWASVNRMPDSPQKEQLVNKMNNYDSEALYWKGDKTLQRPSLRQINQTKNSSLAKSPTAKVAQKLPDEQGLRANQSVLDSLTDGLPYSDRKPIIPQSGAPIEKTPQVGKPDPTAALKQEALKYGSAEEFADSLNAMKYGKVTGVGQLPVSKINKTQIKALTERGLPHTDTNLKVSDFKPGRQVTQPLEVYSKGGSWVVENGNHRLAQALANGDETVPVVFKGGEGKKYSTPITDLYNQAHAETPTPQAPKPQSSALTNQEQVRQRGFTSSVQNSAEVSKDVRGKVGGEYAIRSTKKLAADADAFASNTISKITKEVHSYLDTPTGSINDVEIARSIATAKRLDSMGRFEDAQAIYDKLAEHGTKGGQAIQAFSLLSNRTPDGIKYSGIKMLKRAGVELDRQGLVEFDKLIQKVRKTNPGTEARDRAVYATYDFVARRVPTTVPDKLVNIWRAGLLTAPRTTTGNILGNTTELVTRELWSNPIAVATDKFISLFTGKRTKTLAGGRMSGVEDGFRHSVDYLRTGYDPRNTPTLKYDTARRLNYKNKTIDRYVNGIYRWMGAQDQPFYYVAKSEAARDLAKADAINLGLRGSQASDYIDAAVANKDWKPQTFSTRMDAVDYGKYAAYQNETLLGNVAGAIKQKAKSTNSVAGAIADYILPFTQVPSSVAMRIVDRTPLGVAKEIVSQIANRKFDQRALAEAIGNGSFGVAVWSAGVSLANAGLITGAYPSDQKERKLWEVEGKQPYSVRIGDRWYSLNYMQPMGTILAIGKQYDDDIKSGKSPEEAWLNSGAVAAKSVESQSFLQGVNGMLSAINQPEVSGSTIANQLTGSLMPNLVRSMNTAADPYQREVNNPLDSFIASLPVARQTLLNTKRDMFGKDITARDNPINLAVNPLRPSLVKGEGDIVVNELRRLQDVKEGIVTTKFDMKSISGVELSDTQVRELDTKINSSVKEVWSTVISDPRYGSLTDSEKADVLKKAKDDVAESIKKQFVLDNGLTTTAKYKDKSLMSAFRGAGSGETYAEDYQSALSEMNSQDVKNWSPVERAKKEKRLRQLSVQKDFEKDTVSLYGMTKNEVYALVSKDPNGKKYVEDILKYGDALVAAGLAKYNKFRDRYGNTSLYASSAGGTGRRVSSRSGKKGGGRRGRRSTKGKFDYKLDGFSKVASTNSSLRQLLKKAKMRQGIA